MPLNKVIKTTDKPQFAVGDVVDATFEGGAEVRGTVTNVQYGHRNERWRYQVTCPNKSDPTGHPIVRWFPNYMLQPVQEEFKLSRRTAASPLKPYNVFQVGDLANLSYGGKPIRVRVERIIHSPNPNNPPRIAVREVGTTPEQGRSWQVWETDLQPLQMDLFANWLEKNRDMYRVEQKPIGKDRKKVEGPFPRSIPNTWLEMPMDKPNLSKKTTITAAGKCQMCGTTMPGDTCPRCKYTPTRKQFYGTRITAGDVLPFRPRDPSVEDHVREMAQEGPHGTPTESEGSEILDGLLYQFDMLKGDLQNLMSSAQSWAAESSDPQEIVRLKRMAAKIQAMLKIIVQ